MKNVKKVLVLCVSLALSGVATATTTWTSWTLGTSSVASGGSASATGTATTVKAQGWANTNETVAGVSSAQSLKLQTLIGYSGGLGLINNDDNGSTGADSGDSVAPWHAIDNKIRQEMVLLSFTGGAVNLQSAGFGYTGTSVGQDTGYTVLAYTGSVAPTLAGLSSWSSLPSSWTTIASVDTSIASAPTFANNTYSSYWLIGAALSGTSGSNDAFKLMSVGGCATAKAGVAQSTQCGGGGNNVPEPGSLALIGLGLFGMIRMRKVRKT